MSSATILIRPETASGLKQRSKPPRKKLFRLPQPGWYLSKLLQDHGLLLVRAADSLRRGDPDGLEQCKAKSEGFVAEIARKLPRTLLTPLDCEDIRTIASLLHKLLRIQSRMGQQFAAAEFAGASVPAESILEISLEIARSLEESIRNLPTAELLDATRSAQRSVQSAKRLLRDWRAQILSGGDPLQVLQVEQYREVPVLLFKQYAYTIATLERIRFKNG